MALQVRCSFLISLALVIVSQAACLQVPDGPGKRFTSDTEGVVVDSTTGLEWTANNGAVDLPWPESSAYCAELELGVESDWRLPTIEELEAIHDESVRQPCGDRECGLDPAVNIDSPYVWSSSAGAGPSRFYRDFALGTSLAPFIKPILVRRVLCVRLPG